MPFLSKLTTFLAPVRPTTTKLFKHQDKIQAYITSQRESPHTYISHSWTCHNCQHSNLALQIPGSYTLGWFSCAICKHTWCSTCPCRSIGAIPSSIAVRDFVGKTSTAIVDWVCPCCELTWHLSCFFEGGRIRESSVKGKKCGCGANMRKREWLRFVIAKFAYHA
jgi:hypothetical protein